MQDVICCIFTCKYVENTEAAIIAGLIKTLENTEGEIMAWLIKNVREYRRGNHGGVNKENVREYRRGNHGGVKS
jgi:hypothetical protein